MSIGTEGFFTVNLKKNLWKKKKGQGPLEKDVETL